MENNAAGREEYTPPATTPAPPREGAVPHIRTMRGDVGRLFQKDERQLAEELAGTFGQEHLSSGVRPQQKKRAVTIAIATVLILGAGGVAFFTLVPKRFVSDQIPRPSPAPAPLFVTEAAREVTAATSHELISAIAATLALPGPKHTFTRLNARITEDNRFANIPDLFPSETLMPPALNDLLKTPAMIAVYHGPDGNRLVLAARVSDAERAFFNMVGWEAAFQAALRSEFPPTSATFAGFNDLSYRNIDGRYSPFLDHDRAGAGYAVFPATKILLIANSDDALKAVIDRLFDATR